MDSIIEKLEKKDFASLKSDMDKVIAKKIANKIDQKVENFKKNGIPKK